jgi:hypothetical protein
VIIVMTFAATYFAIRYASLSLAPGAWRTALIAVTGMVAAPVIGLALGSIGALIAPTLTPYIDTNAAVAAGLRAGVIAMLAAPVITWIVRRRPAVVSD